MVVTENSLCSGFTLCAQLTKARVNFHISYLVDNMEIKPRYAINKIGAVSRLRESVRNQDIR